MGDAGSTFLGAIFFSQVFDSQTLEESFFKLTLLSPIFLLNSRLYSEILRISSDLSGFKKSHVYLGKPAKKFHDFI